MNESDTAALGRSGLRVPRLGLGTAPLGGLFSPVSEEEAAATLHTALDLGLRFFDTAPLYGHGLAEQRVGRVLAGRDTEAVIATKVGRLLRPEAPPDPGQFHEGEPYYKGVPPVNPIFDFSYEGTVRSLEESLERLGVARVDILHIHDPDDHYDQAVSGAYPALRDMRREGLISAVGVGMNATEPLVRFARSTDVDCFLVAGRYTLLDQSALRELLPLCEQRGIGVIAGGVYNSGVLARPEPGATYDYAPAAESVIAKARHLEVVCSRHDVPLMAAAIQFPLGHPAVASALTGARSAEEISCNVEMFRRPIPGALWADLKREGLLAPDAPTPGDR